MRENIELKVLNISDVLPNRFQPRLKFEKEALEELAESIIKFGVIEPIVVRPVGNKFEIIAGERRYKASKLASKSTIPAIIINLSDKDSEELALLENVQRQALNPIEEAVSYKRILDAGYITREELAKKIGKTQTVIFNKINLLNLSDEVQSYLLNNKISERHARSLLKITNLDDQVKMLYRIVNERLTVKQTDREIRKMLSSFKESVKTEENSDKIEKLFEDERDEKNMDIDKIMREAKDINPTSVEVEKQNVPNLMAKDEETTTSPVLNQESSANPSVQQNDNKFVNFVSESTPVEPEISNGDNNSSFYNMFNAPIKENVVNDLPFKVNENVVEASPVSIEPQNENVASPSLSDPTSFAASPVSIEPQSENVVSPSLSDPASFAASPVSIEPQNENVASPSLSDPASFAASPVSIEPQNENVASPSFSDPTSFAAPSVSNESQSEISSVVSDALRNHDLPKIEEENKKFINNIPDMNIYQTAVQETSNLQDPSFLNQNSNQLQNEQVIKEKPNFTEIVKILRDCADQIEQSGYSINVDEIDLVNQYKVTITINK